ncbi:MAG: AI-2E family transporter [Fibrobacter sp.]|nr:AI-2E family transporter [Fibrobacter sp.]
MSSEQNPGSELNNPDKSHGESEKSSNFQITVSSQQQQYLNRINSVSTILILFLATVSLCLILYFFIRPVLLGVSFTIIFYPLYLLVLKILKGHKTPSSIITCIMLLFGLLVPLYMTSHLFIVEIINLYNSAGPQIQELFEKGRQSELFGHLTNSSIFKKLSLIQIDWVALFQNLLQRIAALVTILINRTSAGVFGLVTDIAVAFFTMFYFFIDGKRLLSQIRYIIPLNKNYIDLIYTRFNLISKAAILGTLVIGLIQGSVGAVTLLIFGVKNWLVWGFITVIMAIIPLLGTWTVLVPAGIIQIIIGNLWQGIGILLMSFIVVSNLDNLIRPRLVGHNARMHDLMIFFATLGGLGFFGVTGIIIGPIIASFFFAMLDIYKMQFQKELQLLDENSIKKN